MVPFGFCCRFELVTWVALVNCGIFGAEHVPEQSCAEPEAKAPMTKMPDRANLRIMSHLPQRNLRNRLYGPPRTRFHGELRLGGRAVDAFSYWICSTVTQRL